MFAAMVGASMPFSRGAVRTGLQMNAIYVLMPWMLPLASALQGHSVDYAAHFGGAIGGALAGLVMLRVWSRTETSPGFRQAAAAIAVAGGMALAYPVLSVLGNYQAMAFSPQLLPSRKLPHTGLEL